MKLPINLFFSLLLLNSYCTECNNHTYYVNSSFDLEQHLCNTTWSSQYLVLLLNSSINFTISSGNFCQVTSNHTNRIDIYSDSPSQWVTIVCAHNDTPGIIPQSRRGLAFFNTTVTLERLIFKDCGTYLTTIQDTAIVDYLNSSSLYYNSSHAAALVFVHCQVNITHVNIYYSYGFAMIGVNLYDSSITRVNMSNSSLSYTLYLFVGRGIGSGVLLHYLDAPLKYKLNKPVLDINDMNVHFIYDAFSGHKCHLDLYNSKHSSDYDWSKHPIVNAAGLTILYTQEYSVNVNINSTVFYYNTGSLNIPVGLLILHYYSSVNTVTNVNNSQFKKNANFGSVTSYCQGTALTFFWFGKSTSYKYFTYPLIISNTNYFHNSGSHPLVSGSGAGAIFIGIMYPAFIGVLFKNCIFMRNWAYHEGTCIFAIAYKSSISFGHVQIIFEDVVARNNSQHLKLSTVSSSGVFSFNGIHSVNVSGTSVFEYNHGSVVKAVDSNVYLSGNVTFSSNMGLRGSAIRLQGDSHLYFLSGVLANFTNNHAQLEGGALYVGSTTSLQKDCTFIFDPFASVVFSKNTAINSGYSIYIQSIYDCFINQSLEYNSFKVMEYYEQHFNLPTRISQNNLFAISTQPSKLVLCDSANNHKVSDLIPLYRLYPGQTFRLYIAAVDVLNRNVYSTVGLDVTQKIYPFTIWISHKDKEHLVYEGPNCTLISLAILSHVDTSVKGQLVFSLPGFSSVFNINIKILQCPLGFSLIPDLGYCACTAAFYNNYLIQNAPFKYVTSCDINNLTLARTNTASSWAGMFRYDEVESFGLSLMCPNYYCNCVPSLYFCSSDSDISLVSPITGTCKNSIPLCLHQRVGPLCGSCGNLSVVFGSQECRQCSNWWLWTLILYAVAGFLVIYLLFSLKLTLTTGTLNGVIFYAQTANCGLFDLLSLCSSTISNGILLWSSYFSIAFISLLNFNVGFPLCFYNGMTELWKAGLSLLFPLYLLMIVVVLIILSRFSLRLSNRITHSSVQVLVTIVHLSFSKLLLAIIDVFMPAQIYTADKTYNVWYFDGSIEYGIGSHCILMIITLLVVIPLLLPYVLLLICARPIRRTRVNKHVRPLLEAIHAPYKEGKEYWFVARLFLLLFMSAVYSYCRATSYLMVYAVSAPVFVAFLILQAYHKPFKSTLNNIMDCWLMYNGAFLYTTTWIFIVEDKLFISHIIANISVSLVFLTLLVVLCYHMLYVTGKIQMVKWLLNNISDRYKFWCQYSSSNRNNQLANVSDSFYGSCEYREPLLTSQH